MCDGVPRTACVFDQTHLTALYYNLKSIKCVKHMHQWFGVSLGFDNKVVGVVPVGQQVGSILIVHTDVVIQEHPWKEVVDLSGNIQDVTHSATRTVTC